MTTTIPDGTNRPTTTAPMPQGWVVETIIEGRMAWMVKPEPLKPYTFTHDLARAHVFEREGEARDSRASVWCWHDRHGQHPSLEVVWCSDTYRAKVAACVLVDESATPAEVLQPPRLRTDAEILDWLQRQHTLHRAVHAYYAGNGYVVEITHDDYPIKGAEWHGQDLREAYSVAMAHWDLTHGGLDLLAERTVDA